MFAFQNTEEAVGPFFYCRDLSAAGATSCPLGDDKVRGAIGAPSADILKIVNLVNIQTTGSEIQDVRRDMNSNVDLCDMSKLHS